jgi:hypothetical protein
MSELEVALAGKNVSDYTRQALATALSSPVYGDVADMWRKYLEGLGLVGSVGDMFKQFYTLNNVPLWAQNPIYAGLFLTGQFTPASLFTGGEQGGWWSASDLDDTKLAWVSAYGGGTLNADFLAAFPNHALFQDSAGTTAVTGVEQPIGLIKDKSGRGNNLSQATGSSKPVWSARKNLYTATEDFSNGIWASVSIKPTISTDATTAPNGLVTADKWTPAAINGTYGCYYNITRSVGAYTFSIYAKNAGYNRIGMRATDGTSYFLRGTVDLTSGTMVADGSQAGTWTITSVGNGWFKISCSATSVGSFADVSIEVLNNTLVQSAWTPDGTNGIFVWGAELEYGLAATSYQRVVTATNYNAIGFPKYFWTDGVDDNMATASVSFSTDKMSVYAGLNKLSDAAAGSVLELSATIASNNGTFQLTAPVAASATFGYASKGTVLASTSIGSLASPSKRVISAFSDIAGDSVRIDINGTDGTPVVTDQGTGNYGNYPIYAFSRSGGTLPYNGQAHELILLARASTGTEITNTEAFLTPIIG